MTAVESGFEPKALVWEVEGLGWDSHHMGMVSSGILGHRTLYALLVRSNAIPEVTEGKRRAYVHLQFVEVSVHMGLALLLLSLWGSSMAWQVDDMGGCIWWTNRFLDSSQKPERKEMPGS